MKLFSFLAAFVLFVGLQSIFIMQEYELGIVTRFGEFKKSATEPGLYFKVPFADTVHRMERRILGSDTRADEYLTLDKKRLLADPISRWKVTDPLVFYKTLRDEVGAKARIDDIVNSELRREIASHNFGDIIGGSREPLMQEVAKRARQNLTTFGIELVDVRIKRADLPREVQESVFKRMRAERDRIAKQYRAEGEKEAKEIRAQADKEKTIRLAEAYKSAQISRGQGDAESTAIYAAAFDKDAEFYAFSRSLEAYERTIDPNTELVLSTENGLLSYMSGD
ncbi:MAG: protease modulator HflC [Polyangiaceae bacterium]|nr:protease modulator HflC [Polyangiaceae bacterium]